MRTLDQPLFSFRNTMRHTAFRSSDGLSSFASRQTRFLRQERRSWPRISCPGSLSMWPARRELFFLQRDRIVQDQDQNSKRGNFRSGKGFAGVMKRHNMKGKGASHGVSVAHRSMGGSGGGTVVFCFCFCSCSCLESVGMQRKDLTRYALESRARVSRKAYGGAHGLCARDGMVAPSVQSEHQAQCRLCARLCCRPSRRLCRDP